MPEATAFWVTGPGTGELRAERLAAPRAGEVLVQARASGISRGTEGLVYKGEVPHSQHATMRAPFQAGDFSFPVKYGYSSVGIVVDGPLQWRGRRTFCLHPHQDLYIVPADALFLVPDAVPDERAVLAANLETAVNGLWDAGPRIGDQVAVVGAGVVGALAAALLAQIPGVEVELIDVDSVKRRIAEALGIGFAHPDAARAGADLVVHASGTSQGLVTALRLAGFEALVLELSWFGTKEVLLPLGEDFHSRRLTLRSSQVGSVASARRARWDHRRRLGLALRLLADPRFDALLEPPAPFADLPHVMARVTQAGCTCMCQVISYP